jgi:hypothetical protein
MAISKKAEAQIEKPRSSALKMKNPQQNPPAEAGGKEERAKAR